MSNPEFWHVPPNDLCVTCYDESNKATGLVAEKGSEYLCCPDCGKPTCYGCIFCAAAPKRGADIWCAKHSISKSPFWVCAKHDRR